MQKNLCWNSSMRLRSCVEEGGKLAQPPAIEATPLLPRVNRCAALSVRPHRARRAQSTLRPITSGMLSKGLLFGSECCDLRSRRHGGATGVVARGEVGLRRVM